MQHHCKETGLFMRMRRERETNGLLFVCPERHILPTTPHENLTSGKLVAGRRKKKAFQANNQAFFANV